MLCREFREEFQIILCADFRGIFQENNFHNHETLGINKETFNSISKEIIISDVSITQPFPSTKDDDMTLHIYCSKTFSNCHMISFNSFVYMCVIANVVS